MTGSGRESAEEDTPPKPTIVYSLVISLRLETLVAEVAKGISKKH
jgi:hypothetical protein